MARAYAVTLVGVATTAAVTAPLGIQAAANKPCLICRASISQQSNTTSQQQAVEILRRSTGSTNVSTPNKNPMDGGDSAAGFTAIGMAVTLGTAGAILLSDSFNWQNGWLFLPVPEERHVVTAVITEWSLTLPVAPPVLTTNDTVDVLELGG